MQQHLTLSGLVIRETDFGETDRYITVLTDPGSKIDILCRGVRRRASKTACAVRLFSYAEFTLYESRGKYTLNDASLTKSFWDLTQDIEAYALACYFAELLSMAGEADEPCPELTALALHAMQALCVRKRPLPLIKAATELRLFALAGFAPALDGCGACGTPDGPMYFSVREGSVVCAACHERIGGEWTALGTGTLAAMRHILVSEPRKIFSFALGEASAAQLCALCERYALHHAERGFESLAFYHSLLRPMQIRQSGADT